MASSDAPSQSNRIDLQGSTIREDIDFGQDTTDSLNAISKPVELTDLSPMRGGGDMQKTIAEEQQQIQAPTISSTTNNIDSNEISSAQTLTTVTSLIRKSEDESAIGPATERPLATIRPSPMSGPHLVITLLLHSTDTRHPYILNEKYLKRRNVQVADNDPVNLTVYNLKDLIWRDWREGISQHLGCA